MLFSVCTKFLCNPFYFILIWQLLPTDIFITSFYIHPFAFVLTFLFEVSFYIFVSTWLLFELLLQPLSHHSVGHEGPNLHLEMCISLCIKPSFFENILSTRNKKYIYLIFEKVKYGFR